jgi:tripartite-type tricarboxylate transporter receptor subunit TctC
VAGQVKGGQLKVLGVLASVREPVFDSVPTATEQGIPFQSDLWRGVAAPKGLPPAVAERLGEAIRKAAASAEFRQIGEKVGFVPAYLPADAFTRRIAEEDAAIAATMKRNGILLK